MIVPIAVSELLAIRPERPGAFLLRICLVHIRGLWDCFLRHQPFPGSPL
jgi:hypothetical protein